MDTVFKLAHRFVVPSEQVASPVYSPGGDVPEVGAWGHWILGGTENGSRTDITGNGRNLRNYFGTPQVLDQGVEFNYNDVWDTNWVPKGEFTMAVVFRRKTFEQLGGLVIGNLGTSGAGWRQDRFGNPLEGSTCIYASYGAPPLPAPEGIGVNMNSSPNKSEGQSASLGAVTFGSTTVNHREWVFVLYSVSPVGTVGYSSLNNPAGRFYDGDGYRGTITNVTGQTVGLGNAHYQPDYANENSLIDTMEIAEAILFDHAVTVEEAEAVFERSKMRMKLKGIELLDLRT
ncbi:hypothetical protein [Vibrio navarrensis]|uniref:Uncharacterized protein n=1 Tax=Vibrio navarrensis TaxID=29495 RepID=A0AAJ4LVH6_9VIBR|nr:hypothetical protein I3X05_06785 [Vibrio navarrensis]